MSETVESQESRAESQHTPEPWGIMNDGPAGDGKPWQTYKELRPGLTISSPHNTEPIGRLSGYLQPIEANAERILACVNGCAGLNPEAMSDLMSACEGLCKALNCLLSGGHLASEEFLLDEGRKAIAKAKETP